jgi:pimeloyl-ACP methyl ester carboxylesterase
VRRTVIFLLTFLLMFGPLTTDAQTEYQASPESGDFAGLVDIGGRSLYLECHGMGSPTVVLIGGYRSSGRFWTDDLLQPETPRKMVLASVAETTRVCAYDRPGTVANVGEDLLTSRSDAIAQPRTAPEVVAELHALLEAAEVPGPYVLAGHSLGGLFARLYASTYPDEVVGMVLVDAYTERSEDLMTPEQWDRINQLNRDYGSETVATIPGYGDLETLTWVATNEAMRAAEAVEPLSPMPLAVLAHGIPILLPDDTAGFTAPQWEALLQASQADLATLVPDARLWKASESGHDIHQDQPELIVAAITQVAEGVRSPDTWYSLASCCAD